MIGAGLNCPLSSGCGRLFDAVAALLGLRTEALYEGQAAVELESLASRAKVKNVPVYNFGFKEENGVLVPDLGSMLEMIALDVAAGMEPSLIARAFHDCLAGIMFALACRICAVENLDRVVLSGGVFNNKLIVEKLSARLRRQGLKVYTHRQVPPGDGGISLGQAVIAGQSEL